MKFVSDSPFWNCEFFYFQNYSGLRQSRTQFRSWTCSIMKVKKFTVLKWCIWDKFRLQKLGVTKGFFKVKVLSDFDFGHFLRNWLQRHLVGKVLQVQNSSGHYQYVSLVCKTYSKSQEELFDSFFLKMNSDARGSYNKY